MEFELIIQAVPRSPNSKSVATWKDMLRKRAAEIRGHLPPERDEVWVVIVHFYHGVAAVDVDNMAKPILDGLSGVVYADDRLVSQVTARRTSLQGLVLTDASSALLDAVAAAQETAQDLVFVKVYSPQGHGSIP